MNEIEAKLDDRGGLRQDNYRNDIESPKAIKDRPVVARTVRETKDKKRRLLGTYPGVVSNHIAC